MRTARNGRDTRALEEGAAAGTPEGGRPGDPPQAPRASTPLVLPCPLVVFGTKHESGTRRPLADLLRRIAYL